MISSIQYGNKALLFIERRIADDNYRGNASSEHNRYDMEEIHDIISLLNKHAPNKSLMQIRTTDTAKRPNNYPEEKAYACFCAEVKSTVKKKKGTQDSLRKNIFPDIHRMGLIARYDKNKQPIAPYGKKRVKYVSLTDLGVRFATETNILNRYFMFSKAVDILLGGYLELTIDILSDADNGISSLSFYEYMFFVSAVGVNSSFGINRTKCIELIKEYRQLSPAQRNGVISTLKKELNPKLYSGNKKAKRDWGNWVNKITQIFSLYAQTAYLEIHNKNIYMKTEIVSEKDGTAKVKSKRSASVKEEYFKNHKTVKTTGFELHHVIPLSWSENAEQYYLYDSWKNLVYIDAYSHSIITQDGNDYIFMQKDGNNFVLRNTKNEITLVYDSNIKYNTALQDEMLDYNKKLLQTVR